MRGRWLCSFAGTMFPRSWTARSPTRCMVGAKAPQGIPSPRWRRSCATRGGGAGAPPSRRPRFHITIDEHARLESLLGPSLAGDASLLVEEQKFVKSPTELTYIRKAAAIADAAMETMTTTARPSVTELEVAG